MLSQDLEHMAAMMRELSSRHGGLTPHHVEVVVAQLLVHAGRARLVEASAISPEARILPGGNVVPLGMGRPS